MKLCSKRIKENESKEITLSELDSEKSPHIIDSTLKKV